MKKIIQKNTFSILIIFAALSLVGIAVIPMLQLQLRPSQALPEVQISYSWPDSSPQILEQEVTTPLEGVFSTLNELSAIKSKTSKHNGFITLTFHKKSDLKKIRFEIASLIRQTYKKLPQGVSYPSISMSSADEQETRYPLISYMFNGSSDLQSLKSYALNNIKNRFFDIKGISEIKVTGGNETAYELLYDQDQLNVLGIKKTDIESSIRNHFNTTSIGLVFTDSDKKLQVNLILKNQIEVKQIWDDIRISVADERILKLSDICSIEEVEVLPTSFYRVNGLNNVNILFYPEKGVNHLVIAKSIKDRIEEISFQIPQKHNLLLSYDSTHFISKELNKIISRTIITIAILLVFVLIISVSFRYLIIILISLCTNLCLSFTLYAFLGIDIHIYSLAGITISLGLIIDNSIVMIDHIRSFKNKKVYLALLASTLTTIASLVIVLFLPIELRLRLTDFAYIIIINLSVSLIIALWFIPALLEKIPLRKTRTKFINRRKLIIKLSRIYGRLILLFIRWKMIFMIIAILGFGIPIFMLPSELKGEDSFTELYNKTFGSDSYKENIKPVADKILGGSLRLFVQFVYEGSNYREIEETKLFVNAKMDLGIPIAQMNKVFLNLEQFLASFTEIKQFTTSINSNRNANITILFKPAFEKSSFPYILKNKLIQKSIDFGGMDWSVYGVGQGFYLTAGIHDPINNSIEMYGYNYDELKRQAKILSKELEKHPRVKNINLDGNSGFDKRTNLYQYYLETQANTLNLYRKSFSEIHQYAKTVGLQNYPSHYIYVNQQQKKVYVRSKQSQNFDKWQLFHNPINANSPMNMNKIASIKKEKVSTAISKFNQQYLRLVKYQFNGSSKFSHRYKEKLIKEFKSRLPLGYSIMDTKYSYWNNQQKKPYHLILIIILSIFFISSILFESLRQPFAIVGIIPLSYIGIFITFYFFDLNFDQGGYASFILITGLVVNSAIYIINSFNTMKKENILLKKEVSDIKLYLKAFNSKIIPVILTIASSALGLVPFMMLGKQEPFWYAFSAGSIGGLIFSLVILFIYLPIFLINRRAVNYSRLR